ncbi:hypothetical protein CRUP_004232, partial [Coryphaenoides rupestris]
CTGLDELLGIEPVFAEFQDTLFSQASVTLERSVQSKEINAKLDEGISLFLARVSPYFLLKPAQKCLEWLIHRFHIQLYNVDSLLACALPYHETKTFTRRSGVPLARGTLITHCYKDLSFMDFICTMVTKAVMAYSTHVTTSSQLRVVFSFYASTVVSALDAAGAVTDTMISKLLPFVQKGLKSSLADYRAATYMIVCQLAVKVVMEGSLVSTLALQVAKSLVKEPTLTREGLGCLIVLLQNQKEGSVGPNSLVETLQSMAVVHDVSPLLRYLLPPLVHSVVATHYHEMEQDAEVPAHRLLLESIVGSLPLSKGLDDTVHLATPTDMFKFLCMLWSYGANHGDQLDVRVGAVLQTQALYVGRALLAALPAPTLHTLASAQAPVVPSLLGCLSSPYREVRRAAIAVLDTLGQAKDSSSSAFQPIITRLLKNTEEIIADPAHLSQALGVLHEETSADPKKATLGAAFQLLLQTIQASVCPSYTAVTLLRTLDHVNGESVLTALMPTLDSLVVQSGQEPTILRSEAQLSQLVLGKYTEQTAPLLTKDQACLDLFIQALKSPVQPYPDIPSIQVMALEQITKSFFGVLGEEVQQQLLGVMFDLLAESRDALVSNAISSVFKGLAVDAELVAKELVPPAKSKVTVTVQQTRRSKMLQRKAEESGEAKPEEDAVPWQRVTLILELLQHKKKLKKAQALVPALFTLLARQLLLSCLLNVCQKLSPDAGPVAPDVLDEDKFNVELVVQCVRVSDMPQTHHHALLLLGTVASIFPEKVLHNIMPIFTFMGANIMRLDDSYSFQVINKTVQAVIPALIKVSADWNHGQCEGELEAHEGAQPDSIDVVVVKIVHVFVDALPHVPEHRRLPILSQLVATLGPARFLWDVALEQDVEFWISLCCGFQVSEQLSSLIRILQYLMGLPQDMHDEAPVNPPPALRRGARRKEPQAEEKVEELLFNAEAHSSKELRHFKFLSVNFTAQLLASNSFIRKETLRYIHSVAHCVEDNSDKPTAKFWRALLNKAYDVLDKVNSLLPTDTFIVVMKGLMGNRLPSVRRKAMELLNNKLQQKTKWEEPQVTVLISLSGDLLSIVGRGHGQVTAEEEAMKEEEEEEEQAINRQTALYSLKLLCRNFGADHQEAFVPVLRRAVEVATATGEEKNVAGSALLCIAEVASVLKTLAIPQLPSLMPALLQTMEERRDLLSNEIYLLSAVTALQRVCRITRLAETSSVSPQLSARLASLRSTLATKVAPRVLLPTLTKCYNDMVPAKQSHLGPLMSILKDHIGHMEKDQLNSHQSELTSFFLTALDFRAQHCQLENTLGGEEECQRRVTQHLVPCLGQFSVAMGDDTQWKTLNYQVRFSALLMVMELASKLRENYMVLLPETIPFLAELMEDEALFAGEDGVQKSTVLLQYVLDCMFKIFLYDTQHFLSKDRAEGLMGPLVD